MKSSVHVLINKRFTADQLARLRAISPRLQIVQKIANDGDVDPLFEGHEEVFYGMTLPRDLSVAPNLRWLQLPSAGFDHLVGHEIWATDIKVTKSGIHAVPIGEYVFALILALARKLPRLVTWQERSEWPEHHLRAMPGNELHGK